MSAVPTALFREGLLLLVTVGGPLFGALLIAGLIIGVLQSATQINDPAVGFLPRMAAGLTVTFFLGGWIVERLAHFLVISMERMAVHNW
jgi:flagellar biosynthetic protein FliQ